MKLSCLIWMQKENAISCWDIFNEPSEPKHLINSAENLGSRELTSLGAYELFTAWNCWNGTVRRECLRTSYLNVWQAIWMYEKMFDRGEMSYEWKLGWRNIAKV